MVKQLKNRKNVRDRRPMTSADYNYSMIIPSNYITTQHNGVKMWHESNQVFQMKRNSMISL